MHTALVASAIVGILVSAASQSERIAIRHTDLLLGLLDLPVLILLVPARLFCPESLSPTVWRVLLDTALLLLGGLQWYLIASLMARWTCGFQKAIPIIGKRFGIVVVLGLLLVGGCGTLPWAEHLQRAFRPRQGGPYTPAMAFSGDSKNLRQSAVVPTLDTPMPKGSNVVWCGTLQLAWNRLGRDVLHGPPDVQGAEVIASRLNKAQLVEDDLPPDAYLAAAGLAKDGIVEKVRTEMEQRFHKAPEIDSMAPNDILAYAYLEANAAFTIPFFDNRQPLHFHESSGRDRDVSSFGIEEKHEYAYDELREQINVLYVHRKEDAYSKPEEFVIDLCRSSSPNQVVVACVPRQANLAETLADVEKKTEEYARQHPDPYWHDFGVRDVLLVPNLNWEVRRQFAELEGPDKRFRNAGFREYHISKAMQTIRFRLDRSGAELFSEAPMFCKPSATFFIYDRPFMIVVKKRGAERPFFVMWVDNAELLCRP
jgi:hypothetical protein